MPRWQRNELYVILPIIACRKYLGLPVDITHSPDYLYVSINGVAQMLTIALFGFVGSLAHAVELLPRTRYTKRGGMRFFRIGRLQTSFCICKKGL